MVLNVNNWEFWPESKETDSGELKGTTEHLSVIDR